MPSIWVVCTLYGVECDMRAAMSCPRWPVQWLASVAAVFLSFLHDEKSKIRRSQRTKESRPTSRAYRTWRPPLPHVGRVPRAQPSRSLAFPHTEQGRETAQMDNAPAPCRHRGPFPFQRGCPKGGGLWSRDLLCSWDSPLSSLRVIARHEAIHLCQIYVRFVSKKSNINFIPSYLPDSKRQQTTIVDYKRLING